MAEGTGVESTIGEVGSGRDTFSTVTRSRGWVQVQDGGQVW